MVQYALTLKLKDSGESYRYVLDLTQAQENHPEQIFVPEIRERIRDYFQKQSACKVSDFHLNKLVKAWLEDIREGYRTTQVSLDLPLLIEANVSQIQESGNQELPELIPPDLSAIEPCLGMLPPLNFS